MQNSILWRRLLGVDHAIIEDVDLDDQSGVLVCRVRPVKRAGGRCGICRRRCPGYDSGGGRRRWRGLDLGTMKVFLEAEAPRVSCRVHGVVVASVPWARHGAGHTYEFDAQIAWLVTQCSKSAASELMRIAWRSVGSIIERYWSDVSKEQDRFAGLRRIGIDEISYKRGHKYLMVVVDHDTGRLVWAAPGRDRETLDGFFSQLAASGETAGQDRLAMISHVTADGARFIHAAVKRHCPQAVICADPFHVVKWAGEALDTLRRQVFDHAPGRRRTDQTGRRHRATGDAQAIKRARYSLWKNPEDLTENQRVKLAWIQTSHPTLFRGYLLKEALRTVFKVDPAEAPAALEAWIGWARRSRLPPFVELQRKICTHKQQILAAIEHGLSNGRVESVNTKIRLITRIAFGFHGPEPLIALAMLNLAGHKPHLPGRT